MSNALLRKILLGLWGMALLIFPLNFPVFAAQTEETAADDVTKLQAEISADIAKTRTAVEAELENVNLESLDVVRRLDELASLNETVSDDMAAWGYTEAQRELHTQILSELTVAYTAYNALTQVQTVQPEPELPALPTSPDINTSDALRQEINKVSRGLDIQVFMLQSKLSKLRLDLANAERLKKEAQEDKEGGAPLELPRTHTLALESARLNVALSSFQVRTVRQGFDQNVALIGRLKRRLAAMKEDLIFPEEVLNANLKTLQERIDALIVEMEGARKALDSASSAVVRARAALTGRGAVDIGAPGGLMTPALSLYMARTARATYWEYMTTLLDDEIALLRETQQVWRERYKLFRDEASGEEIWKDRDEAQKRISDLNIQLAGVRTLEADVFRRVAMMQKQMEEAQDAGREGPQEDQPRTSDLSAEDRSRVLQNMLQAIENGRKITTDVLNRYEALIPNTIFFYQRLYTEASDRISALRIAEKVHSFSRETIMGFLDTELWQGEGYSVTVWRLAVAILVFLSSFFLSSMGSRWLKRRMMSRFNASETAASATQRIVFYILWIAFALTALNIVNIPLTAFAFLGGAFAVGFGFGMQNIFNNLISGFIVIFSRPFKVSDIISVAGTEGTVQDIGSRSTTIKTWDGLDVVLPNRYFLENSVTNWTGSDQKKRNVLTVGVAYDADTRKVEALMLDVVKGHSKVLKDPAPFVIFRDFGDSALEFEAYYWIDLRQASAPKVGSDMRHHLISLFREEGIEIPYPQRDIHIIPTGTDALVPAAAQDAPVCCRPTGTDVKEAPSHETGGN